MRRAFQKEYIIFKGKVLHQLGKQSISGERRTQIREQSQIDFIWLGRLTGIAYFPKMFIPEQRNLVLFACFQDSQVSVLSSLDSSRVYKTKGVKVSKVLRSCTGCICPVHVILHSFVFANQTFKHRNNPLKKVASVSILFLMTRY